MAAAVIFLLISLTASLFHTWKMWRMRIWFCIPFIVGGFMEVVGYGGRISANNATDSLGPYIIQSVLLLVPPSLFAVSIYMTLGRVMHGLGPAAEQLSVIRINWLTKTFVIGDAFIFLIQACGAGYMAAGTSAKTGEVIAIFGLVVQIAFFGLFVVRCDQHECIRLRTTRSWEVVGSADFIHHKGGLGLIVSEAKA